MLVCVDGSAYADKVCAHAAWAAKRLGAGIDLLHVLRRHSDYQAPSNDHTGTIGLGARSLLLKKLTEVDEERGRLDQKKGKLILDHCTDVLAAEGVEQIRAIHRRGSLVETIQELEPSAEMIFVGKRGEHADEESHFLGSNLEKVARAVHKPLYVMSAKARPITRFMLAYDGRDSIHKAIDFLAAQPLLQGLDCHLVTVEKTSGDIDASQSRSRLQDAGFNVIRSHAESSHADQAIAEYVARNDIGLLVTGAYSHTRIRSMLLGSTTASLIQSCRVPLLLFR